MKLDIKRVEILFNEIKSGLRVLRINGLIIYLKYPEPALARDVIFIEEEIKQKYKGIIPTKDEILDKYRKISEKENIQDLDYLLNRDKKISLTIDHFEKMGMSNKDQTLVYYLNQKKDLKVEIAKSRKLKSISNVHSSVKARELINCLDTKINQTTIVFYIQNSLFFRKNEKLVPLFQYLKFKNINEKMIFINKVFDDFVNFMRGYEESEVRGLARSSYISNLYKISNKTNTPMFEGASSNYNQLQVNLLSWCDYYHSIFTNLGAPEKHIIEDDILFDKWVEGKIDDMKSSDKKSKNNSNNNKETNFEQVDRFIFKEPTHAVDSNNYRKI